MSFNDLEQGFGVSTSARTRVQQSAEGTDSDYKSLTQRVSQQVFHINGNITSIERLVGFLGTSRDTPDIRNKLHDVTEGTRDLIKETTSNIKLLTQYTTSDPKKTRQRKLEQQKLSKDFQKVLAEFQKIQRESVSKQREYVDKKKATTAALQSQVDDEEGDQVQQQEQQQLLQADDAQRRIQIEALDNEIEYNETLISEREGEIQGIEQGITELNEIFRDLGMLVNEQDSGIQSIYGNVLNISQNTKQAADELTTANRHQKRARKNMCCFMLIITIVGCVLALIIVVAK
ncbi:hypothetical protein MUCCIDRAFT_191143 [Mucor lusitanicus CBS 277.49]|uniref:t-SNARE coiled-coil homology domain-containing protein n=1 Tax=Mucor lusitanicus CBS 277.49 TaxID=747725 RepID=A0A168HLG4_MUCCL|nr:hypothetical protein MUCCIDRAFT_191143 [Mucor lusitanicus CBS 277.49]